MRNIIIIRNKNTHKSINDAIETFQRKVLQRNFWQQELEQNTVWRFYITPKVHKKDIPGRPVVNSIDCHANFKIRSSLATTTRKSFTILSSRHNRLHKQTRNS